MTPRRRRQFNFMLDADLAEGMKILNSRDGTPVAEMIRRALREWLEKKGVIATETDTETERPRASTRRRS